MYFSFLLIYTKVNTHAKISTLKEIYKIIGRKWNTYSFVSNEVKKMLTYFADGHDKT